MQESDTGHYKSQATALVRFKAGKDADTSDRPLLPLCWPPRSWPEPLYRALGGNQVYRTILYGCIPSTLEFLPRKLCSGQEVSEARDTGRQMQAGTGSSRHQRWLDWATGRISGRTKFLFFWNKLKILSWLLRKSWPRLLHPLSRSLLLRCIGVGMTFQEGP